MVNSRIFVLLVASALSTIATPSPWHRHHKHRHHPKPSSSTSAPSSSLPGSVGAFSQSIGSATPSKGSVLPIGTSFPTLSLSASGTSFPTLSVPSASGTAPPNRSQGTGTGTAPGTAVGTAVGTGSRPSYSVRPTGYMNSTSGLTLRPTYTPSKDTGLANATGTVAAAGTSQTSAVGTPCPDFVRGVNIGGWLLLDATLNAQLLSAASAVDEWTFDSLSGASEKLSSHWDSYFQETDVQFLKTSGVNAIKIPIGYWAYDNSGTPYQQGADAYLEKAISWAEAAGMKVWIDLSNTDSTQTTFAEISSDEAVSHSLSILTTVAKKYGSSKYANTVTAIEIFATPISLPQADSATLESFPKQAFSAIKTAATNPNLQVVVPDASSSPQSWQPVASSLSPTKGMFSVAESESELTCPCEQEMTQAQHIQTACQRGIAMAGINYDQISIYVGEFNPATNATMDVEGWTPDVITDVRKYVEAQLEVFEAYTSGYFFWSWAQDSEEVAAQGWGFKSGITKGYIPNPLNDPTQRKYPGQCIG